MLKAHSCISARGSPDRVLSFTVPYAEGRYRGDRFFASAVDFPAFGYRDSNDLDDNPHHVPSQALYDAQLAFTGIKNLKLAVGVKNLFDKTFQYQETDVLTPGFARHRVFFVRATLSF